MHVCDTYASIGSAFSCQEPDAQYAPGQLEYFFFLFSAVILVVTVLGGKEGVRSTYDGQISPISSRGTGILTSQGSERKGGYKESEGGDRGKDRGRGEPTISACSTRKFVLVRREG
jgi:hypothetical protein